MKSNFIIPTYDQAHYTKGKEYSLDLKEYIGEYHFRGIEPWTEPLPSVTSRKLSAYSDSFGVMEYDMIRADQTILKKYADPYTMFPTPTEKDYDLGTIVRYFVKDRTINVPVIIEIDSVQASKYGAVLGIDPVKYQLGSLIWAISAKEITIDKISLVNTKSLYIFNKTMPGIIDYLPNTFELSFIVV